MQGRHKDRFSWVRSSSPTLSIHLQGLRPDRRVQDAVSIVVWITPEGREAVNLHVGSLALLQHTYRVLLTRGMKGTFVYSTDWETREYLKDLLKTALRD